ncbi:hypothetical protein [Halococcus sp. IIIV-5B]|uniref:hypothetical protein n=1 Tax=Halococcus sp. IIIV-5B TaxID=2321230 RepID=UPI0018F64E76|nr:hypothetical protein [Halococcus sp. IIIV-5B]
MANRPQRRSVIQPALTFLSVVVLLYSFLIAGQLLLGVWVVVFVWIVYFFFRLVLAIERIASALEEMPSEE